MCVAGRPCVCHIPSPLPHQVRANHLKCVIETIANEWGEPNRGINYRFLLVFFSFFFCLPCDVKLPLLLLKRFEVPLLDPKPTSCLFCVPELTVICVSAPGSPAVLLCVEGIWVRLPSSCFYCPIDPFLFAQGRRGNENCIVL